jgi:pyruvate kinase
LKFRIRIETKKSDHDRSKNMKTKIVATVGPACSSREMLGKLIKAGVDVFRLNFSHGAYSEHLAVIENVRSLNAEFGTHVALLGDLQGPKIRIGAFADKEAMMHDGARTGFYNQGMRLYC